jgi:hypothetical protein
MSLRHCRRHCGCRQTSATRHRLAPNSSRRHEIRRNSEIRGCLPTLLPSVRRHCRTNASCRQRWRYAHCWIAPHCCRRIRVPRRLPARLKTVRRARRRMTLPARHRMNLRANRRTNLPSARRRMNRLRGTSCSRGILRRHRESRHRHALRQNVRLRRRARRRAHKPRQARRPAPRSPPMTSKFSRGWMLSCQLPFSHRRGTGSKCAVGGLAY